MILTAALGLVVSGGWPQAPTSIPQTALSLHGPVQLTATVEQKCVLSASDFKSYKQTVLDYNRAMYEKNGLPKEAIDRQMASMGEHLDELTKPRHFSITYATDGKSELYIQEDTDSKGTVFESPQDTKTVLFDGTNGYLVAGGGKGVSIKAGRNGLLMVYLPFPGLGLPLDPLSKIQDSAAVTLSPGVVKKVEGQIASKVMTTSPEEPFGYLDGFLQVRLDQGHPAIDSAECLADGKRIERWEFADRKHAGDLWFPQSAEWTEYEPVVKSGPPVALVSRRYRITQLSTSSLPADMLKLSKYVMAGAEVLDRRDGGLGLRYKYDPTKSWDEMRKAGGSAFGPEGARAQSFTPMPYKLAKGPRSALGAPGAQQVLEGALRVAKQGKKQVFLYFTASWCVPCHMEEAYLRSSDVARVMDKYYVFTKIDVQDTSKRPDLENEGGEKLHDSVFGPLQALPCYAILDEEGKVRTNFVGGTKTNPEHLSIPGSEPSLGHLMRLLHDATPAISMDDLWKLRGLFQHRIEAEAAARKAG